jgi:hypothetical protein
MDNASKPSDESIDFVSIPRRTVSLVGMVLPAVAIVCFLAGWMIGSLTTPRIAEEDLAPSATVSLKVRLNEKQMNDPPPIAMLLPSSAKIRERQNPEQIRPATFQPLNNPMVEAIQQSGGDIARLDAEGQAALTVTAGEKYLLVVLASGDGSRYERELSRQELAALSQYFLPVDTLFRDGPSALRVISVGTGRQSVGPVTLD